MEESMSNVPADIELMSQICVYEALTSALFVKGYHIEQREKNQQI